MSWRTLSRRQTRVVQSSTPWRRLGLALLMGLALAVAACGTSTGGGGHPTPTAKPPSPTATPVPCTGWRTVASPTTKYPNSRLSAVSALSPTDAWAVGDTYTEGATTNVGENFIERWDGSAWHIVASGSAIPGGLNAIAAISSTDVWAVGEQPKPAGAPSGVPLTMHWDGSAWSVVRNAGPTLAWSSWLSNVVAITPRDVWAFGGQYASPPDQQAPQVLVEHWDGAQWQIVRSPPLPSGTSQNGGAAFSATLIPGTNQLWAVGEWHQWLGLGRGQPLIERWNGSAWQIVPSPALPKDSGGGGWNSVVALSPTDAWAVGSFGWILDSHPMIAHWDGSSWQNVVADSNTYAGLYSVAAGSANDVRAAGWIRTGPGASSGNGQQVPLIEQWNGTNWQIATVPALPSGAKVQQGSSIATDGAGNYWAMGSYLTQPTPNQYLTLPLTLHCP